MTDDAVMDALDLLKDWAMQRMLGSGKAPDGETGDKPPEEPKEEAKPVEAEIEIDAAPVEEEAEELEDDEDEPKNTVLSRHFIGGALPKKTNKVPVSRR